ncbi:MAG: MBG domain-containing protein [Candidatus Methylacidiphilales bacterium]
MEGTLFYNNSAGTTHVNTSNAFDATNSVFALGGGLLMDRTQSGAIFEIRNVTFTENSAHYGGGIAFYDEIFGVTLDSVTIARNNATQQGGGLTWGFPGNTNTTTSITIRNSIIALNTGPSAANGPDVYAPAGRILDGGFNLIGMMDGSSSTWALSDPALVGTATNPSDPAVDPLLGTLANYGGSVRVLPLLPGSPALNVGDTLLTYDQRGTTFMRPSGGGDDIGAYEQQSLVTLTISPHALSKIYGEFDPTFTFDTTGLYAGHNVIDVLGGVLTRSSLSENFGTYDIINQNLALTTFGSLFYNLVIDDGTDLFTINQRAITITPTGLTKVYGDADPGTYMVTAGSLATLAVTDHFNNTNGLLHDGGENVGTTGHLINRGSLTILNSTNTDVWSNYAVTLNPGNLELTITPRPITVAPSAGQSKIYGDADPILRFDVVGSLGFLDTPGSVTSGALSRTPGENVGSGYQITIGSVVSLSNPNYQVTIDGTPIFFSIVPRPITVTTAPGQGKTYGAVDPGAFQNVVVQGSLVFGDTLTGASGRQAGENGGSFGTMQNTLSAGSNYILTWQPGIFAITPRALTLRPEGLGKLAGRADPDFSFSFLESLAFGDTPANVFAGSLGRTPGETPGSYFYTLGTLAQLSSANYTYSLAPGTAAFTITAEQTIQRDVGQLARFGATRGRNNEDPESDDNLVLIPNKRKGNGYNISYAPPRVHPSVRFHLSSYHFFGQNGHIAQQRAP